MTTSKCQTQNVCKNYTVTARDKKWIFINILKTSIWTTNFLMKLAQLSKFLYSAHALLLNFHWLLNSKLGKVPLLVSYHFTHPCFPPMNPKSPQKFYINPNIIYSQHKFTQLLTILHQYNWWYWWHLDSLVG